MKRFARKGFILAGPSKRESTAGFFAAAIGFAITATVGKAVLFSSILLDSRPNPCRCARQCNLMRGIPEKKQLTRTDTDS